MLAYVLEADANRYRTLEPADTSAWGEELSQFHGAPIGAAWTPLRITVLPDGGRNQTLPQSDFPSLASWVPVFSGRAAAALADLLEGNGELLPLDCPDGEYYAFNVTRVVDALDAERSGLERLPDGEVHLITRHVFRPDALRGLAIFKMPYMDGRLVYVTDRFVRRVEEHGLTGFSFLREWVGPRNAAVDDTGAPVPISLGTAYPGAVPDSVGAAPHATQPAHRGPCPVSSEVFLPTGTLTTGLVRRIVEELAAGGLSFERTPGGGGDYWTDGVTSRNETLASACAAFAGARSWGVTLRGHAPGAESSSDADLVVTLMAALGKGRGHDPLDLVGVSVERPADHSDAAFSSAFRAWVKRVVGATGIVTYARAGDDLHLHDGGPIRGRGVAARKPPPLQWLNVFGPEYAERLGRERLLSAPAWSVEAWPEDAIALTVGPAVSSIATEDAAKVAQHLGLRLPR